MGIHHTSQGTTESYTILFSQKITNGDLDNSPFLTFQENFPLPAWLIEAGFHLFDFDFLLDAMHVHHTGERVRNNLLFVWKLHDLDLSLKFQTHIAFILDTADHIASLNVIKISKAFCIDLFCY